MNKTIIEPNRNPLYINLRELFQYRELLWTLAYRDFKVKYAQTFIGFTWAFINPIFTLLILTFVFGTVAQINTANIPHPIYTIAGLCGWSYFAAIVAEAGNSIIGAQQMVQKIYFPRLIIPLSKAVTAFIDFIIVIFCLVLLMIYFSFPPSYELIYFPFFVFMAILSGLTGGIWLSALTIRFRDFKHIIPLLLRLGMFITPIAYPGSAVPEKYQIFFYLNPMAGIVEGIRWSIIGGTPPEKITFISYGIILLLFIGGLFYFNKVEKTMADII